MPVCVPVFVWNELHLAALHGLQGILCKGIHLQEPLHRKPRLYDCIRPFRIPDRRSIVLRLFKIPGLLQHLLYLLPRLETVLSHKYLSLFIQTAVVVNYVNHRKVVPEAYLIVIHIMGRCHFQAAGAESHLHIRILYDRYLLVNQRNEYLLSFQPVISFVFRIDADCGIGHDCFGPCGRYYDIFVRRIAFPVRDEISQMVEFADRVPVDHLLVTDGSMPHRVPVDHPDATVDISFLIEIHKCVYHGLAEIRVHCELGPVPVT